MGMLPYLRFLALFLTLLSVDSPRAQDLDSRDLSLERLLNLDITSVSMRPQKLMEVASSVYVIRSEDIRRSGATRIQDLLNLVPGAWFGDVSYSVPTGEIRENAIEGPSTILWILDGVHIMNPIGSGIMFETFDVPLSEIERIEVIKGPGGSIYGANAATGIVSIFTKSGMAAEGLHVSVDAGTQKYLAPTVRYGWEAKENLFLTVWSKFKHHDGYDRNPGFVGDTVWAPVATGAQFRIKNRFTELDDNQQGLSGGVNWDYQPSDDLKWTGWISEYQMGNGQYSSFLSAYPDSPPATASDPKPPDSVFLNPESMYQTIADGRVDWIANDKESLFLNISHWHYDLQSSFGAGAGVAFDVSDLEFQNEYKLNAANHVSAGSNVRRIHYQFRDLPPDGPLAIRHMEREDFLFGVFLQDEILMGPKWHLTMGAKAETYTLTGKAPEISPSLRLAYLPSKEMTFWGAASRSITTASYIQSETDFRVSQIPPGWYLKQDPRFANAAPPAAGKWVTVLSGDDVKPVDYYTLEAGHRGSHGSRIQWDLSAFYKWGLNRVSVTPLDPSLQTVVPSQTHPGDTIVPLYVANLIDREDFGGESLLRLMPTPYFNVELSYALFYTWNYKGLPIPGDPNGATFVQQADDDKRSPKHIGRLKTYLELPWDAAFTANLTVTSPFSRGTPFNYLGQVWDDNGLVVDAPATEFHLDLVFQKSFFRERCMLSIWGRDLLADPHVEAWDKFTIVAYPHQVHRTFGATLDYQL
ncbi:MAG: TonB-dependent receptor, plug [Fibrobacteres bacterium]|nr:TonB-dependent receptor, plug [Fibrobacterota bacterium]